MLRAQLGSRKLNSPLSQPNLLTKLLFNIHNMIIIYHLNVILIFECDQNQEICLSHSFQRHWHQNLCCLYYHIHTLTEIKEIILPSKNIKNNTNLACDQGKEPFF